MKLLVAMFGVLVTPAMSKDTCDRLVAANDKFRPIRIHARYEQLDLAADETALLRRLVDHVISFVAKTVKVRRVKGRLTLPLNAAADIAGRQERVHRCGSSVIRGPDLIFPKADLVVTVVAPAACDGFMSARPCSLDACGRPISGQITVCPEALRKYSGRAEGVDMLAPGLLHEMIHVLGFLTDVFSKFRDAENRMQLRDPSDGKSVHYTCTETNGRFAVQWDVAKSAATKKYTFPASFLKPVDARGLLAAECRCPFDKTKAYTNEDIQYCMRHPNHCAVAVTSPAVKAAAREYYGCDTVEGQEVENAKASCESIIESHWKLRTLKNEIMNFVGTEPTSYVSPMTLALLADSGWYQVDYGMATARIPTGSFGFKAGCEFVTGKCISDDRPVDDRVFCIPDDSRKRRCSPDALRVTRCDVGDAGGWEKLRPAGSRTQLPAYDYGRHFRRELYLFDFCPVYEAGPTSVCVTGSNDQLGVFGPDSRCLESLDDKAMCQTIDCDASGGFYHVISGGQRHLCATEGDLVPGARPGDAFICRDPSVVCANWMLNHYMPDSYYRRIPGLLGSPAGTRTAQPSKSSAGASGESKSSSAAPLHAMAVIGAAILIANIPHV